MPHRAFFAFVFPSLAAMIIFIALPIVSVAIQSFYVQHDKVIVETETCSPFGGCKTQTRVDAEATEQLRRDEPLGKFNGFGTYLDRNHLAVDEVKTILSGGGSLSDIVWQFYNLPFYKALSFTLAYTFIVTPLAMALLAFLLSLFLSIVVALVLLPKTLHLLAELIGNRLRQSSRTRRELLLDRVATETKAFEAEHKVKGKDDDDWEKILPSQAGSAVNGGKADADWNGIVGFFHPFWYAI